MQDRDFFISVAMATYNGERFIKEQITSILKNLKENDEIIISDDGSIDNTLTIIQNFSDKRIKIIKGPKKGVKQNFANAIANCSGKYIFLSDQDDIWLENKVSKVLEVLEERQCTGIVHDCIVVNEDTTQNLMDSFFEHRKSKSGIIRNIYKNRYLGCCMAFSKDMAKSILPIPETIEMHDQWIGLLCEKYGSVYFMKEKLIKYRRHYGNVSAMHHYPLLKMIQNRVSLIREFWKRIKKN